MAGFTPIRSLALAASPFTGEAVLRPAAFSSPSTEEGGERVMPQQLHDRG